MSPHVDELISAYIDNEISDAVKADVEEHLQLCAQCQSLTDELFALKEGISTTFEAIPAPEDLEMLIMTRIEEKELSSPPITLKVPWVGITIGMVALLTVITSFPFLFFGFGIVPTLFHLLISISKIIPIVVSSIPFLAGGLMTFTLILMVSSVWALKRVFERGGIIEKRVG